MAAKTSVGMCSCLCMACGDMTCLHRLCQEGEKEKKVCKFLSQHNDYWHSFNARTARVDDKLHEHRMFKESYSQKHKSGLR